MKRYSMSEQTVVDNTNNKRPSLRPVRMVQLTSEYFKSHSSGGAAAMDEDDEEDELATSGGVGVNGESNSDGSVESVMSSLGMAQTHQLPLFAQMFARIEQVGKTGISLKQIGTLFAFDFYKSRRMGNNLQAHPDVVTIMKETNKGKTKFQTIVLRRMLDLDKVTHIN